MFDGSMKMFFCTLNCPLHLGGVNKKRTLFKIGTWSSTPVSPAKPLSILLHIDGDDDKLSEIGSSIPGSSPMGISPNNPALSLANTIGIIGGVSATSTLNFLGKLIRWSLKDGKETLPFIVCSDSVLGREHSSQGGSSFLFLRPKRYLFQFDHTLIVDNLRQKRGFLEKSGARCIVMPCNISHSLYNEISDGCSVPFLHLAECVAKELKEANLKPVEAGSNVRIGVLATDATLTAGFYQEKLQNQGFEVVLPDKATMEHTVFPAMEALKRKDTVGARNLLRIALQVLLMKAVNSVILASDDVHELLAWDDPLLKKCVDPLDALARSTLKWAQSTEKVQDH